MLCGFRSVLISGHRTVHIVCDGGVSTITYERNTSAYMINIVFIPHIELHIFVNVCFLHILAKMVVPIAPKNQKIENESIIYSGRSQTICTER